MLLFQYLSNALLIQIRRLAENRAGATQPLAVFFEQKQCINCDILHQKILRDGPTRKLVQQFDTVQLDMWSQTPLVTPAGEASTARDWAKR